MKSSGENSEPPRTAKRRNRLAVTFGVMGGASPVRSRRFLAQAHELGRAIAENGCVLITGACPGLPHAAACGAKQAGGTVIGISPAMNLDEHVRKYRSPIQPHDVLIFTGSGLMGREVINIRSSDAVVIVGGRSGTLGELAIAYDEGKPIGVLRGTGGVSDMAADILEVCAKDTGSIVIYRTSPRELVADLLRVLHRPHAADTVSSGRASNATARLVSDPVCGMTFAPAAAAVRRTWGDRSYFFCSHTCADAFIANPKRYCSPGDSRTPKPLRKSRRK